MLRVASYLRVVPFQRHHPRSVNEPESPCRRHPTPNPNPNPAPRGSRCHRPRVFHLRELGPQQSTGPPLHEHDLSWVVGHERHDRPRVRHSTCSGRSHGGLLCAVADTHIFDITPAAPEVHRKGVEVHRVAGYGSGYIWWELSGKPSPWGEEGGGP